MASPQVTNAELTLIQGRIHSAVILQPTLYLLIPALIFEILWAWGGRVLGLNTIHGADRLTTIFRTAFYGQMLLPLLVLWVPWTLERLAAYLQSNVTVTSHRVVYRTGFLLRYTAEIPLSQVEFLSLLEPLVGRLLGYGTVTLRGNGGTVFHLTHINNAASFHATLQRAMQRASGIQPTFPVPVSQAPKRPTPVPTPTRTIVPKPLPEVRVPTPPQDHWPKPAPKPDRAKPPQPKPPAPPEDDSRFWPKS